MAARRLVIVMLVLLGLSTLAAALVPGPDRSTPTGTGTVDTGTQADSTASSPAVPRGRLVQRRLRIARPPATVAVDPGDQLRLAVAGRYGDDIAVPAFGLTETMTPYAPARFDILIPRAGTFPVRSDQSGRVVGRCLRRGRR